MSCTNCEPAPCDCPIKDLGTDCSVYNREDNLTHIDTPKGTILSVALININTAFGDLKATLASYFQLTNVGLGKLIYKGSTGLGVKQLRSLIEGNNITLTENPDDITFEVLDSTESVKGVIQIASQVEVDNGLEALKAVTPATLKQAIIDNAADGSETKLTNGANISITGTGTTVPLML